MDSAHSHDVVVQGVTTSSGRPAEPDRATCDDDCPADLAGLDQELCLQRRLTRAPRLVRPQMRQYPAARRLGLENVPDCACGIYLDDLTAWR